MNEKVDRTPAFPKRVKHRVDRCDILDVAGHHEIRPEFGGKRSDPLAQRLTLIGEGNFRTLCRDRLGNSPGDRVVVGNAHDQAALALHDPGHQIIRYDAGRRA